MPGKKKHTGSLRAADFFFSLYTDFLRDMMTVHRHMRLSDSFIYN